jgi:hypothetical protein
MSDYQLGQRIGALLTSQGHQALDVGRILSEVQDLAGADTALNNPIRDLLTRPAYLQLLNGATHSMRVAGRDALLQDLCAIYHPSIVSRLATVINGSLGLPPPAPPPPPSTESPPHTTYSPPPPAPSPVESQIAMPPSDEPGTPQNVGTLTYVMIALLSLLVGALLAGGAGLWFMVINQRGGPGPAPSPKTQARQQEAPAAPPPAAPPPERVAPTPNRSITRGPLLAGASRWGGEADYKFGRVPDDAYPDSCAFSRTDPDGRITTEKASVEYWACRDDGGTPEDGYSVVWADGKQTTYWFGPDGVGEVRGTNGDRYPMRWRNGSHGGQDIIVIDHEDGAISWIPRAVN